MKTTTLIKNATNVESLPHFAGSTVVIEMPNGERFEALSGGVSAGRTFLDETGKLGNGLAFVLKPAIEPNTDNPLAVQLRLLAGKVEYVRKNVPKLAMMWHSELTEIRSTLEKLASKLP